MMTNTMDTGADTADAELVAQCCKGDREAFAQIVSRYQTLICSLAYSATGSLSQSQDLAQETFVAAWQHLRGLREPHKLRAWLCGIARNLIHNAQRRQKQEPTHAADSLEQAQGTSGCEPLPVEQTIRKEEEAILWNSLARIPEAYREPLVLFYRERQSVEKVARALDLSEDAVKQRLSRGRKLLHEEVIAFVEGTLKRTNPGKAFTFGVLAALPILSTSAKAATLGLASTNGTAVAKAAASVGLAGAILGPVIGILGGILGAKASIENTASARERRFMVRVAKWTWMLAISFGLAVFAFGYQAFGGGAIGWLSAMGGAALAHGFALGGAAFAQHANDEAARTFLRQGLFLKHAEMAMKYATLLVWLPMVLVIWQSWPHLRHPRRQRDNDAKGSL